jgi:hypothetical protein
VDEAASTWRSASASAVRPAGRGSPGAGTARCIPEGADIEIVGGDMFEDVPADGDAYLLSTVLRCFDDTDCERVLRRCAARMRPGGCVLALEMVMPNGIPPSPRGLADLQALVVYGGRDRTDSEWTALLGRAGFDKPRFIAADGPYSFVQAQLT